MCWHIKNTNIWSLSSCVYCVLNTNLGPLFGPLLAVSICFLHCPVVAGQTVSYVNVRNPSPVKLIVQLEEPSRHVQILSDQLGQALMKLYTRTMRSLSDYYCANIKQWRQRCSNVHSSRCH